MDSLHSFLNVVNNTTTPPIQSVVPVLMARKKEKPKDDTESHDDTDDTGRKTFDMKKYLEDNPIVNAPDKMILEGHSKKALDDIENAVFKGVYRAKARWGPPPDELPLEYLERLVKDGWKWKDAVMEVYPDTKPEDLDGEVNRLQHQLAKDRKESTKGII
jgi:hypothetical protein